MLNNIGNIFRVRSYYTEALENFEAALAELRAIDEKQGIGLTLGNIASLYIETEQHEKAEPYILEAIQIFHEIGNKQSEANFLGDYAKVLRQLDQLDKAIEVAEQAVAMLDESDTYSHGTVLNSLGLLYIFANRLQDAQVTLERALACNRTSGNQRFVGITLSNLGIVARDMGDTETAIRRFQESSLIHSQTADIRGEAIANWNMLSILFSSKQWDKCHPLLNNIIDTLRGFNFPALEIDALLMLAELHWHQQEINDALSAIELAENAIIRNQPSYQVIVDSFRGLLMLEQGNLLEARVWLDKAQEILLGEPNDINNIYWAVKSLEFATIAETTHDESHLADAIKACQEIKPIIGDTTDRMNELFATIQNRLKTKLAQFQIDLNEYHPDTMRHYH